MKNFLTIFGLLILFVFLVSSFSAFSFFSFLVGILIASIICLYYWGFEIYLFLKEKICSGSIIIFLFEGIAMILWYTYYKWMCKHWDKKLNTPETYAKYF